jgi:hypothetical protein
MLAKLMRTAEMISGPMRSRTARMTATSTRLFTFTGTSGISSTTRIRVGARLA